MSARGARGAAGRRSSAARADGCVPPPSLPHHPFLPPLTRRLEAKLAAEAPAHALICSHKFPLPGTHGYRQVAEVDGIRIYARQHAAAAAAAAAAVEGEGEAPQQTAV